MGTLIACVCTQSLPLRGSCQTVSVASWTARASVCHCLLPLVITSARPLVVMTAAVPPGPNVITPALAPRFAACYKIGMSVAKGYMLIVML